MALTKRSFRLHLPSLAETPAGRLLNAWSRNLLHCMPSRARRWLAHRRAPRLIATVQGNDLLLLREVDGERSSIAMLYASAEEPLGTAIPSPRQGWREIVVELPAANILVRNITLPAQVKDNLLQVVGYELDRLTPFGSQDVYYDFMPVPSLARGARLEARLALCRRDQADPWLARLREQGIEPGCLTWQGAWSKANLLPSLQRPRKRHLGAIVSAALILLIIALLVAVMISPVTQKNREFEQLDRVLRRVRIEAEQVPKIRDELERARAGSVAVLDRKASQPRMIDLLRELTDRLPDHTWVQTINVRENEVDIRGESDQATELLSTLEQAPGISNVSFRSPVMQVSNTGKERFHISFRYQRPTA